MCQRFSAGVDGYNYKQPTGARSSLTRNIATPS